MAAFSLQSCSCRMQAASARPPLSAHAHCCSTSYRASIPSRSARASPSQRAQLGALCPQNGRVGVRRGRLQRCSAAARKPPPASAVGSVSPAERFVQELEAAEEQGDSSQERHLATLQEQLTALQQQVGWHRMLLNLRNLVEAIHHRPLQTPIRGQSTDTPGKGASSFLPSSLALLLSDLREPRNEAHCSGVTHPS